MQATLSRTTPQSNIRVHTPSTNCMDICRLSIPLSQQALLGKLVKVSYTIMHARLEQLRHSISLVYSASQDSKQAFNVIQRKSSCFQKTQTS